MQQEELTKQELVPTELTEGAFLRGTEPLLSDAEGGEAETWLILTHGIKPGYAISQFSSNLFANKVSCSDVNRQRR